MSGTSRICCRLFSAILLTTKLLFSQQETPCPNLVGLLVTQFTFKATISELPRVEIRQCGTFEVLQIVAWEANSRLPSLILDTTDFTVVQSIARKNLYLIETTGGARNRIYIIVFEKGKPRLALKRVTKGTAKLTIGERHCEVVISGIYAGDAEPRTEKYKFDLSE